MNKAFKIDAVKWQAKPVMNWFIRDLFINHSEENREGLHTFPLQFSQPHDIEIDGKTYLVKGITCNAERVYKRKGNGSIGLVRPFMIGIEVK